jgi:hypothetical protein
MTGRLRLRKNRKVAGKRLVRRETPGGGSWTPSKKAKGRKPPALPDGNRS